MAVCPGCVFVVDGAVLEASVEYPDEAVPQDAQSLVAEITLGASLVVERSASLTLGDRTKGPLVDSVIETPVLDVAGQDNTFGA